MQVFNSFNELAAANNTPVHQPSSTSNVSDVCTNNSAEGNKLYEKAEAIYEAWFLARADFISFGRNKESKIRELVEQIKKDFE